MHYLYYVAVPKGKRTAKKAKIIATNVLDSNGFAGENGFYNTSKADWYVIGGRWSGHLQAIQMDDLNAKGFAIMNANKKDKGCDFITSADIENNNEALQSLWESLGGKGQHYWDRDNYDHEGAEDDSMLLDKKLFDALKIRSKEKKNDFFNHETEIAIIHEDEYIDNETTITDFLKQENIIGNYYIVVIDYHN